ncbi:hypothetical protein FA15DRAFT_705865 [Coprinopsis marcescibilis]|uniref:Uncharacterized protein n=1 Tax=Coprinopsis marcescibilis TaxID=230819 RepID=A0A5C3KR23_COPMA|nr:hypothetical protein FA15DRAFT_705865 [Coprinopsis marcescibilis]
MGLTVSNNSQLPPLKSSLYQLNLFHHVLQQDRQRYHQHVYQHDIVYSLAVPSIHENFIFNDGTGTSYAGILYIADDFSRMQVGSISRDSQNRVVVTFTKDTRAKEVAKFITSDDA